MSIIAIQTIDAMKTDTITGMGLMGMKRTGSGGVPVAISMTVIIGTVTWTGVNNVWVITATTGKTTNTENLIQISVEIEMRTLPTGTNKICLFPDI